MARSVLQALFFYPRGGSAQVVRYLSSSLIRLGDDVVIVSGSAGQPGDETHAPTFFEDLPVYPVDYSPALRAAEEGEDPLRDPVPLHPSYEDRADVPDRVFTAVAPSTGEHIEASWRRLLRELVPDAPGLIHAHHLTPMHAAFRAIWQDAPIVGHLHGTDLNMLEAIEQRETIARTLEIDPEVDIIRVPELLEARASLLNDEELRIGRETRWDQWRYARYWKDRMQQYADMCDRFIVLSEDARDEASGRLGIPLERIDAVPNGADISRFYPERLPIEERLVRWQHWLVEDPRGWDEQGEPGTIRYGMEELNDWFVDQDGSARPVLMFVGRFTEMKRVPLLIRAFKQAQERFTTRAPLVIWGGNPGEWEGEHPVAVARAESVPGVFFVGWRGHNELPTGLNAADIMVAPSTNEPFGQVYLEAMACALPVIGTRSGGPLSFVDTEGEARNGWLVEPDSLNALADALVEAVNNDHERRLRGTNAVEAVRRNYSWDRIAEQVQEIYERTVHEKRNAAR